MDQKDIRIGVFCTLRGKGFIINLKQIPGTRVTAVCDFKIKSLANIRDVIDDSVARFENFADFIASGLFDAVILTNYFSEHAAYAIQAMERGIHVLCETTPAVTLAECVALCRAVEKTGCKYMLAENYPFFASNLEMKRLYQSGRLGRVLFSEGEYVHPMTRQEMNRLSPGRRHWRNWCPSTYYLTHALAPVMHITGSLPVAINCKSVYDPAVVAGTAKRNADAAAIVLCEMNDGSLARITGWSAWGGHGNWYRICGERGNVQNVPGQANQGRVQYNSWQTPEGAETCQTYDAQWFEQEALNQVAAQAGHGGGDFWVTYFFIKYLAENIEPFFNVYRSVAMAAGEILALRSSQNHGVEYRIPDFTNEADRQQVAEDTLSPFPDQNGRATIACCSRPYEPTAEDYASAEKDWTEAGLAF